MEIAIIIVFVLGYTAIALEHPFHIDKAASALVTGVVCWALFVLGTTIIPPHLTHDFALFSAEYQGDTSLIQAMFFEHRLLHHLSEISGILFFLMGAMTIVELVDAHEGFAVITDRIKTQKKVKLLWIVGIITFFLSAALDNLTTSIVMISLLRKLIEDKQTRWMFAGMVVISANAGGAWSPIGDVTTTMLWIGGQISAGSVIVNLFVPSLVCMLTPLAILSWKWNGQTVQKPIQQHGVEHYQNPTTVFERTLVFSIGLAGLLFVPVFKSITHLPPFMGMMLSLGILWVVTELLHRKKNQEDKSPLTVVGVLRKIDVSSVLFFLGILLAVSALAEVGHLRILATGLKDGLGNIFSINIAIGLLSAIVDNVPLVAASMGMYDIVPATTNFENLNAWDINFLKDGRFWQFLAYCAGTGGSALIIGSAAGVAVMGLEKIDFIWYLKRISLLAILGYLAGAFTYILMFGEIA